MKAVAKKAAKAATPEKRDIDWALIEVDYRAGVKTLEQIGADFGVTKGRISQVAKKQGWSRDLSKKIRQRAEAKLAEQVVNETLNAPRVRLAEAEVVEANAQAAADVVTEHRSGLRKLKTLYSKLFKEVEAVTDGLEDFERLGELLDETGEDATGKVRQDKLNQIYRKVISINDRIDNTKKLAEIDEKVRKGEREAWGIDKGDDRGNAFDDLIKKINGQ